VCPISSVSAASGADAASRARESCDQRAEPRDRGGVEIGEKVDRAVRLLPHEERQRLEGRAPVGRGEGELYDPALARLREALEESTVPYRVDVIDLSDVDTEFRERVRREGILWIASASA